MTAVLLTLCCLSAAAPPSARGSVPDEGPPAPSGRRFHPYYNRLEYVTTVSVRRTPWVRKALRRPRLGVKEMVAMRPWRDSPEAVTKWLKKHGFRAAMKSPDGKGMAALAYRHGLWYLEAWNPNGQHMIMWTPLQGFAVGLGVAGNRTVVVTFSERGYRDVALVYRFTRQARR